ncbi:MAG: hypothetical protein VXY93_18825, partial [Pseudomonadota bacterium]|nr:hypothetical protein [Pseudomonadota bacterium]
SYMAFTKVVGAGIHTLSNITSHNINSSGIITATKFVGPFDGSSGDFSGNVNIDGNLIVNGDTTTLNTTLREVELLRVDANSSAAAGIITQRGSGDILNLYDGATKVVTVDDEGDVIAGVGDLATHTGSRRRLAITDSANGALLHIRGQSPAVFFDQSGGNIGKIYQDNADLAIYAGRPDSEGANTVRIDSSGRVMIGTTTLG